MLMPPAAEILTIGDELCRGEIVDTNASWIAERLTALGLHVRWKSSTVDDPADMSRRSPFTMRYRIARTEVSAAGSSP